MNYTREQLALALTMLDITVPANVTQASATALARPALRHMAEGISLSESTPDLGTCAFDPETGYTYEPREPGDCQMVRALKALYQLFGALHPGAPLWAYEEREARKQEASGRVRDESMPMVDRIAAFHEIALAHFARSASASLSARDPLSFVWHPGVQDYMRHYVYAAPRHARENYGERVFAVLMLSYEPPEKPFIDPGKTLWTGESGYTRGARDDD
ncbi:hypothetical protein [Paraburkholderia sp. MM6662-R1]|uniref:hypothetical protein n=1 Tax=Paraburkholderia sp. MM6662-R1 TaxID=2991066 RepID=UPI003D1CF656